MCRSTWREENKIYILHSFKSYKSRFNNHFQYFIRNVFIKCGRTGTIDEKTMAELVLWPKRPVPDLLAHIWQND
jgi:hypothetical protein